MSARPLPGRVGMLNAQQVTEALHFILERDGRRVKNIKMEWTSWLEALQSAVAIHLDGEELGSVVAVPEDGAVYAYRNSCGRGGVYGNGRDALNHVWYGPES